MGNCAHVREEAEHGRDRSEQTHLIQLLVQRGFVCLMMPTGELLSSPAHGHLGYGCLAHQSKDLS